MKAITICTFLLTFYIIGVDMAFYDSWLDWLYPTSEERISIPPGNRTLSPKFQLILVPIDPPQSTTTETPTKLKHELEDEYHPENKTTHESTQEIDETNHYCTCTTCATSTPSTTTFESTNKTSNNEQDDKEKIITKHDAIKPKPKHDVIKIKPMITITSTVVEIATEYTTVVPSCLKLEHVSRVCDKDSVLITLELTPVPHNNIFLRSSVNAYAVADDYNEPPAEFTAARSPSKTRFNELKFVEPSDYDYQFESLELRPNTDAHDGIKIHGATPKLRDIHSIEENQFVTKSTPLRELHYTIQSETISITKTLTTTNTARTATIVASHCLPRDIRIPKCTAEPNQFSDFPRLPQLQFP